MYRYKLVNNDDFKVAYKKYLRKNLLKVTLIIISIATLIVLTLLFLILIMVYELQMIMFICISSIVLILESLIFYNSYKKESKRLLNITPNGELNVSFDEKGILLYHDSISRQINWHAVRKVIVDENILIFQYKVNGMPGNFFYLKFFDVQKDELIKDIEKYIKVKGC